MLPPRTRLDPRATTRGSVWSRWRPQASIVAAYRAKARLLHPDVPGTGDAEAFVAVKQAYDMLSNRERSGSQSTGARAGRYRADARSAGVRSRFPDCLLPGRQPLVAQHGSSIPRPAGGGLGWSRAFLFLCVYQVAAHLLSALAGRRGRSSGRMPRRSSRCRPARIAPCCMVQPRSGLPARPISMSCRRATRRPVAAGHAAQHAGSARPASAVQRGAGGAADPSDRHAGGSGQRPGQRLHQCRPPDPR